ncbi:hypothetical protein FXO37_19238 [Capsicum annuum]|nr:hypothetical protein FXO37_19238 [Capsicum annuum]
MSQKEYSPSVSTDVESVATNVEPIASDVDPVASDHPRKPFFCLSILLNVVLLLAAGGGGVGICVFYSSFGGLGVGISGIGSGLGGIGGGIYCSFAVDLGGPSVVIDDFEKFNNYPWGYGSYYLTVQYLLTKLSTEMIILYSFPWAFMVVPTEQELGMTSFITLGLVDTKADPTVESIEKELARAIAIRRSVRQGQPNVEALHDQPFTKIDPGASSEGVVGGVVDSGASQEKINTFENTPYTEPSAACGSYSLAYIECLLNGTEITGMRDAIVGKMQEVWAYGVLTKWLEPVYK